MRTSSEGFRTRGAPKVPFRTCGGPLGFGLISVVRGFRCRRSGVGRLPGEPGRDWNVEADTSDDWHSAAHFFDRRPHDRKMLGWGQRIELAGASGGDDRGRGMRQHRAEILAQAVEVERQVGLERRYRKADHPLQRRP